MFQVIVRTYEQNLTQSQKRALEQEVLRNQLVQDLRQIIEGRVEDKLARILERLEKESQAPAPVAKNEQEPWRHLERCYRKRDTLSP